MIDITKKYRTRDGREVTKLRIRGSIDYPIVGVIDGAGLKVWRATGSYRRVGVSDWDLIEVTEQPDTELVELRAFRDAAIAKYPDLAPVDPIEAEIERIYQDFVDNKFITGLSAIRVAVARGIEIGKGEK